MVSAVSLGTLYGVSIGVGDPELITLKGLKILQSSKIIAFPAGVGARKGMAEQIVDAWLEPQQQKLPLHFPYTQNRQILEIAWQEAAEKTWLYLSQGFDVTFACLGDVNFYSTFNYLAQAVQQSHPECLVKTISGVCSPVAIASTLGTPLACQDQSLAIIPALYGVEELKTVLDWADVIVLLKFSSVYQQVWQLLARRKLLPRSYIVENISFPNEKIYQDLSEYPCLEISYFSTMVIKVNPS